MTPKQVRRILARAEDQYWALVEAAAEQVRVHHVIPYCDKMAYDFSAGMGSWSFHKLTGDPGYLPSVVDEDTLPKRLREMLENPTLNRSLDFGAIMEPYETKSQPR